MNVFLQECRMNRKTTLLWMLMLCSLGGLFMSFYPIINSDLKTFLELVKNFPPVMQSLTGMLGVDFSTPLGYYTFAFTFAVLCGAIQAMNLGVGIVSKETRDKTADFLMTKPISRIGILNAKLSASVVLLALTSLVYSVVMNFVIIGLAKGDYDARKYILLSVTLFFVQIIFFSIGLIISVAAKKIRVVLPISLGIVFFFYALSAFAVKSESDKLRFATPFQYFKSEYILKNGSYETAYLLTGLCITVVCVLASYLWFCRKDIHSV